MFTSRYRAIGLAAMTGLLWICAAGAESQDPGLKPTFGAADLKAGFLPDPHVVKVTAGGPIKTKLGGESAHVAKEPSFSLSYTAGAFPLIIHVDSQADTTLLINLPDGKWVANDDRDEKNLNPLLRFDKPASGRYDIFVGTFGPENAPATLFITELPVGPNKGGEAKGVNVAKPKPAIGDGPDPGLDPGFGSKDLLAGFTPDPVEVKVIAGGPIETKLGGVNAYVSKNPDFRLNYTAGKFPLTFHVNAKADTTLLINLPDGKWIAIDDFGGSLNPQIKLDQPQSGRYSIFVGTFGREAAPAVLYITELK